MRFLDFLFGRNRKPEPTPPPPVLSKPVIKPKPKPTPGPNPGPVPPPVTVARYAGLNLINFANFSPVTGVIDEVKLIYTGLKKGGVRPLGRIPGGTEANYFRPSTVLADADDLVRQVANLKTIGADALLVLNHFTGTTADDVAMMEECKAQGVTVFAIEGGNEAYLGKYNTDIDKHLPVDQQCQIAVDRYLVEAQARCTNIKSLYPGTKFGLTIMPAAGMRDTNNSDTGPDVAVKSATWNAAVTAATFGDFYQQHFYPDGVNLDASLLAFTAQKFNKPVYITETNCSGTQDQQAQWFNILTDGLASVSWAPVVIWHSGPTGGNKWTVMKVNIGQDAFAVTPFGQAMLDRK